MAVHKTPGMYVEETGVLSPSVVEVKSAVPAFIGYSEKAVKINDDDLVFIPLQISSLAEYENFYGKATNQQQFVLYYSLQLFYANGGGVCYIVSIGKYNEIADKNNFIRGLDEIKKEDGPTLLLFPDAVHLPGNDLYDVQKAALQQCTDLENRFCIVDLKYADTQTAHSAVVDEFRNNIGINNLQYGAAYTPHLKIQSGGIDIILPPSGAVAGVYCLVDTTRGVWKAPANVSLNNVMNVVYAINNAEQDKLNVDVNDGKSINAIRRFTGKGILVWGARTLKGNDNEWRYVPVRRFFNMVKESIKKSTRSFVFEANDANTWIKVQGVIENYLTIKWREGALQGSRPEHAFFVNVGLNKTMTALDILQGKMIVEVGMAPLRPAEFIMLRFTYKMATS
jgi:uncharacterized protein